MTKRSRTMFAALLGVGVLLGASPAEAVLCSNDTKSDGTGKAMRWAKMPVSYYINASKVAAADKAAAIKAVQDAFAAYEKVTCTSLKFAYKGESTSVSSVNDAILVNFTDVSSGGAYYYGANVKTYDPPDITDALIQMNIKDYKYVVGAQANAIDIQTAVTQMIPGAIGFYAGTGNAKTGSLPAINFNVVTTTLTKEQQDGVIWTYPGTGCPTVAEPPKCATVAVPGDTSKPAGDGGTQPKTDGGTQPTSDGVTPQPKDGSVQPVTDAGPIGGDPSTLPPKEDDGGCCRVGHTGSDLGNGYLALLGLLVLGALLIRGRRRR